MTDSRTKDMTGANSIPVLVDEDVAYLAKRHRVSPGVVREIVRQLCSTERAAVEREIEKGKSRR